MVKVALIGAGKMGISHLSILGAHPEVEIAGVCDTSKLVTDVLTKYSGYKCFSDYKEMLDKVKPDAVFVAVPTMLHAKIIKELLELKIHVFAEKPFVLIPEEGLDLMQLAEKYQLVNQVGYHNRFIGTFKEVKRLADASAIGEIYHFQAESYGPVVTRKKQETWRSKPEEGGGCLPDYASHTIDLVNYIISPVVGVQASLLKSVFSSNVEDAAYAILKLKNKVTGILSVNWSDETHRKMSTTITINGTRGKIISDANELKVYFRDDPEGFHGYTKGWNTKYITELAPAVDFYLRGEEYSEQIDYFIKALQGKVRNEMNTFGSALETDLAISMIKQKAAV